MTIQEYSQEMIAIVRAHAAWAPAIMFVLAFAESLAFVSLLIPAWGVLVAIGALVGPDGISFWPVWIAGSIGAALGDWLSFWLGVKLGPPIVHMWPLSSYPDIVPRGEAFVKKWGVLAIFVGKFSGPLRAGVPLAAGIFEMPHLRFLSAAVVSSFIWAAVLLSLGDVLGTAAGKLMP